MPMIKMAGYEKDNIGPNHFFISYIFGLCSKAWDYSVRSL